MPVAKNGKNGKSRAPSPDAKNDLVSACNKVARRLQDEYGQLPTRTNKGRNGRAGGWRVLAARYSVPAATIYRVAMRGYYPHNPSYCKALGLPHMTPVACCPDCGEPPLQKRHSCPARTRKPSAVRRVRFSERDTVAALKMTLDLVLGVMYGHARPRSAAD